VESGHSVHARPGSPEPGSPVSGPKMRLAKAPANGITVTAMRFLIQNSQPELNRLATICKWPLIG
jgi:hypothetical protein